MLTARKVVSAVVRMMTTGDRGRRRKWGRRKQPGTSRKAGKVMRLNMPVVMRTPSMAEDTRLDLCW